MAKIIYDRYFDLLAVDLHGCWHQTARTASEQKILECVSCGIRYLELVFGQSGISLRLATFESINKCVPLIEDVWSVQQASGELDFFKNDPCYSRAETGVICVLRCDMRVRSVVSFGMSISSLKEESALGLPRELIDLEKRERAASLSAGQRTHLCALRKKHSGELKSIFVSPRLAAALEGRPTFYQPERPTGLNFEKLD